MRTDPALSAWLSSIASIEDPEQRFTAASDAVSALRSAHANLADIRAAAACELLERYSWDETAARLGVSRPRLGQMSMRARGRRREPARSRSGGADEQ
jgi:hypothetical protein